MHSGLLSLSVHEALTFEGTEIAIHPDLFVDTTTISISSSRHSVLVRPPAASLNATAKPPSAPPTVLLSAHHERQTSDATLSPSLLDHKEGSKLYTVTSESQLLSVAESHNSAPNRKLEVGNMVEIRVWDTKATAPATAKTTMTKQLSPAAAVKWQSVGISQVGSTDSLESSSSFLKKHTIKTTKTTLEAAANVLKDPSVTKAPRATLSSSVTTTTSLQYSVDSPSATIDARTPESVSSPKSAGGRKTPHSEGDGGSTVSTIAEVNMSKETSSVTTTSPKFPSSPKADSPGLLLDNTITTIAKGKPRSRSNTNDYHAPLIPPQQQHQQHGHRPGKPPLVHRTHHHITTTTRHGTTRSSKPAHFRDISDMTMDTTMLAGAALAHHDHDLISAIHGAESHDDGNHHDDITLSKVASTHTMRLSIVMLVTEKTLTSLKGQSRSQISMLRQVADLYELSPYDMVTVSRIEKDDEAAVLERVSADFVTVTIKDQFISRGDMHFFQKSLIGRWIHEGERIGDSTQGIKAHAREIRHADNLAKSGIITEDTKITFRTRSTRVVWLVQISSEMWDYASPYDANGDSKEESICELVFDKFVQFMYKLFQKWKELEVTHSLTIIFFSRTFLGNPSKAPMENPSNRANPSNIPPKTDGHVSQDIYGRLYEDHYKTVVDNETPSDWDSLVVRIKREFVRYPFEVGWDLSKENYRRPSTAMQGNLLEAINVTLNLLQFHFLDRDLHRTGNSIVVVSPECGVFEVDRTLSGITYQRMMDNGIGSDMVCLGLPPLHVAPFFLYNNVFNSTEGSQNDGEKTYSEVPHWMHLSFVSYDGESVDKPNDTVQSKTKAHASSNTEGSSDELRIAPNGFLMPAARSRTGKEKDAFPMKKVAGLSSNPISPGVSKSQSQQRQLISGRDFKDILEACRPRTSSYMLPTPLANLLNLHAYANRPPDEASKDTKKVKQSKTDSSASFGRLQLKEWGTVDFEDTEGPMSFPGSSILRQATARAKSPIIGIDAGEVSVSSGKSSPSSSITSQLSNILGRSLERGTPSYSFLSGNQSLSPALDIGGLKIQRSPSLEFESETNGGDAKIELDADNFLTLMRQHDAKYSRAAVTPTTSRQTVDQPGIISAAPPNLTVDEVGLLGTSAGSISESNGGLGAALMRFNTTGEPVRGSRDPHVLNRINSSLKIASTTGSPSQFGPVLDLKSRSVSIYAPPVGLKAGGSEPPELPHVTPQAMQAFMRSQQQIRLVQDPTGSLSSSYEPRRTVVTRSNSKQFSRQLSRSPPPSFGRASPSGLGHSITTVKMTGSNAIPKSTSRSSRRRESRHDTKNRKSVVNPFRQQDEDDELEKKSHNRRRWSHVFSLGELEFKRHAGPLWKSLCQPAVLPLTIDYFPSPQELEDANAYGFTPYQLTLQGMEQTHYASHRELLMEMVRQRVTQDFQVVPPSVLSASNAASEGDIQHTLSMGHRIHVLTYDSQSDTIDVKLYTAITEDDQPITYHYLMYCPFAKSHSRVTQTFKKYSNLYRWNSMDHVILEDTDLALSESMRCRRLQFGLVPPKIADDGAEQDYVDKFKRLLDYLGKLREKDETSKDLDVKIIMKKDDEKVDPSKTVLSVRRGTTEEMRKFTIRLRKGKRDLYEWVEVAFDSVFDTSRSYRIMFNWLIARTSKVEAQVQLLQRRCVQYGLELVIFPQTCISRDLFLNPLVIPQIICIRQPGKAKAIADWLKHEDFIYDGTHMTDPSYLQSVEKPEEFCFPQKRKIHSMATNKNTNEEGQTPPELRSVAARQFVHRATGGIFTRLVMDEQTWVIVVVILNHKLLGEKVSLHSTVMSTLNKMQTFLNSPIETSVDPPIDILKAATVGSAAPVKQEKTIV